MASKGASFVMPRAACLAMIASAAEVFPRECMGGLCCDRKNPRRIIAAFPWQKAKRKYLEVVSDSSWEFHRILGKKSPWSLSCDFHSHTYRSNESLDSLEPSKQDLTNLDPGEVEVIVRVHKTRSNAFYARNVAGHIEAAMGKFRFQIKVFMRLDALDENKTPLYKIVGLRLE